MMPALQFLGLTSIHNISNRKNNHPLIVFDLWLRSHLTRPRLHNCNMTEPSAPFSAIYVQLGEAWAVLNQLNDIDPKNKYVMISGIPVLYVADVSR